MSWWEPLPLPIPELIPGGEVMSLPVVPVVCGGRVPKVCVLERSPCPGRKAKRWSSYLVGARLMYARINASTSSSPSAGAPIGLGADTDRMPVAKREELLPPRAPPKVADVGSAGREGRACVVERAKPTPGTGGGGLVGMGGITLPWVIDRGRPRPSPEPEPDPRPDDSTPGEIRPDEEFASVVGEKGVLCALEDTAKPTPACDARRGRERAVRMTPSVFEETRSPSPVPDADAEAKPEPEAVTGLCCVLEPLSSGRGLGTCSGGKTRRTGRRRSVRGGDCGCGCGWGVALVGLVTAGEPRLRAGFGRSGDGARSGSIGGSVVVNPCDGPSTGEPIAEPSSREGTRSLISLMMSDSSMSRPASPAN